MFHPIKASIQQKHDEVQKVYSEVIAELGENARHVTKKSMYAKVSERTGYSQPYVAHIITEKLRENNHGV